MFYKKLIRSNLYDKQNVMKWNSALTKDKETIESNVLLKNDLVKKSTSLFQPSHISVCPAFWCPCNMCLSYFSVSLRYQKL